MKTGPCRHSALGTRHSASTWSRSAPVVLVAALLVASLAAQTPAPARRIVSLVPALTEMAFAIGAGEAVVGVSSFDRYPQEVGTRTRLAWSPGSLVLFR